MAKKTGKVSIALDGNILLSKKGASLEIGGVENVVEMSDQDTVVTTETTKPSVVKCTLLNVTDTDLVAINRFAGTVTYITDNGHRYVCPSSVKTTMGPLANGEVDVTFSGAPAELA